MREEGLQKRAPRHQVCNRREADEQREQAHEEEEEKRESENTPQIKNLKDRSTVSEKEDVQEDLIGERAGKDMSNGMEQDIAEENLENRIVGGVETGTEDYVEECSMNDEDWYNADVEGLENREEGVGTDGEPQEKREEAANVEQRLVDEEDVEEELV